MPQLLAQALWYGKKLKNNFHAKGAKFFAENAMIILQASRFFFAFREPFNRLEFSIK